MLPVHRDENPQGSRASLRATGCPQDSARRAKAAGRSNPALSAILPGSYMVTILQWNVVCTADLTA
jgi:hypothetical protein